MYALHMSVCCIKRRICVYAESSVRRESCWRTIGVARTGGIGPMIMNKQTKLDLLHDSGVGRPVFAHRGLKRTREDLDVRVRERADAHLLFIQVQTHET